MRILVSERGASEGVTISQLAFMQMREWKLREGEGLAQGYTASQQEVGTMTRCEGQYFVFTSIAP